MTDDERHDEARAISGSDPHTWEVWRDSPEKGERITVGLYEPGHSDRDLPERIGDLELEAVDTEQGVGFELIVGIDLDEPVTEDELGHALREALDAQRDNTETRQLVQAIAAGLPAETVTILRDRTDRPRLSEELATVAWVYSVVVDRYGRRDPNEWIKLILGYKSTRTAQRRVAEARARGLITAPAEVGRTTRSTTKKGKKK